ncbi:hypothetical protein D6T64_10065 [Cryobacterium melibiosiphilum]|uniref:Uncharacterized protein n=1 Tax=Cryobacterium melibiosiphilum TaxID=995039 RepID=A0A3A5MHB6_9MICO|nr:hypothetical protein [Cryobacterium melibiosiphilum]RJT88475.1 hypothetical protein D6T64_10065 [Cryobacterium melibiosiphilum]
MMTQNHTQNQNENTSAFGSPLKKRFAVGAVTALAAGSLLGLGAVGATAAPLDVSSENGSSNSTTASAEADTAAGTQLTEAEALDQIATLTEQLQADLAGSTEDGSTDDGADATQIVTDAIAGHGDLFQSLPANLQSDLTALGDANTDQAIAADTIETTALSGGYGEQLQKLAEAIQQDPEHPLAAVLQAVAASDAVAPDTGAPNGLSAEKITDALAANPALFEKLPQELQADLTELQAAPEGDRAAGADEIKATALDGGYGEQIQAIAERVVANFAAAEAGAEAEAGADVESDEADTDVKTDAAATAGGHDAN